ncbi:MAG: photosystem II stability/assembly factor-like uncharacterized protein [Gammaproteobacteria bacterium]|jgi:photosystem II stability/assembly factor-like uncharacterized protein
MRSTFSLSILISQKISFCFSLIAIMFLPISVQADDDSTKAKLAAQSMLFDGISKQGVMVVVGERGHVLLSSNDENWEQIIVPTRATLTGVYFHDKHNGWAVGHDAVILLTADGGKHWQKTYYDPEGEIPLFDVWFKDDKQGLAIGAYGLYLVSDDGGASWNTSEMNISEGISGTDTEEEETKAEDNDNFLDSYDVHLNSIGLSDNGKLYIAAEAGQIFRSDDFGESWVPLSSPYIGSFFGVLPLAGDSVLVYGLRGHLFRSDTAGDSWQEIKTPTQEMLTNAFLKTDGEIYITGLGGVILKSTDEGMSFSLVEQGHRDGFTAIIQSSEDKLFTVGEKGVDLLK